MVAATQPCAEGWGAAPCGDAPSPDTEPVPLLLSRVVAVAVTARDLLRPGSDLARAAGLAGLAGPVDLLLACADEPARPDAGHDPDEGADDRAGDPEGDAVRAAARRLGLPGLALHRLALRAPLGAAAEGDLVAALSELVGFDPEPGLQLLAPAPLPGDAPRAVVDRSVRRVAEVYRLPTHHYR